MSTFLKWYVYPYFFIEEHNRFKYSSELEKILDDAMGEAKRGMPMIGIYNSSNSENSYGIKFDKMRRELPSK